MGCYLRDGFTIVLPTYNERENVCTLIRRLLELLSGKNFEIIVVDDNSPDGTANAVRSLNAPNVRVVVRKGERGLASAILRGFSEAHFDTVVVMDADLQHPPEAILEMLEEAKRADVVIGSRYVRGGSTEGWSFFRKLVSKSLVFLTRLLLLKTRPVKDPLSGYFLVKKSVLRGAKLSSESCKLLVEILVRGKYKSVAEVPIRFSPRKSGKSKLGVKELVRFAKDLYRLALLERIHEYFFKFSLVGASGIPVYIGSLNAILYLAGANEAIPEQLAAAGFAAFEISVLWNFTWNEIWTFRDVRKAKGFKAVLKRCLKYHAVTLVGGAISVSALVLLSLTFNLNHNIAALVGVFLAALWNFLASHSWAWFDFAELVGEKK